jgi:hypothetical protein
MQGESKSTLASKSMRLQEALWPPPASPLQQICFQAHDRSSHHSGHSSSESQHRLACFRQHNAPQNHSSISSNSNSSEKFSIRSFFVSTSYSRRDPLTTSTISEVNNFSSSLIGDDPRRPWALSQVSSIDKIFQAHKLLTRIHLSSSLCSLALYLITRF